MVPVKAVKADLVTKLDHTIYVPIATKDTYGSVKIGDGLDITNGVVSFDESKITIKSISKNGTKITPDENKNVNIVLTKSDVGLDNVDNTSDLDKPVSTKTQSALNTKLDKQQDASQAGKFLQVQKDGTIGFAIGGGGGSVAVKSDDTTVTDNATILNFKEGITATLNAEDDSVTISAKELSDAINNIITNKTQISGDSEGKFIAGKVLSSKEGSVGIGGNIDVGYFGVVLGWYSSSKGNSDVVIGVNSKRTDNGYSSIAIGGGCKIAGYHNVALGSGAKIATSNGWDTVQIAEGTNNIAGSLQFRSYQLVDPNGKIPNERLNLKYAQIVNNDDDKMTLLQSTDGNSKLAISDDGLTLINNSPDASVYIAAEGATSGNVMIVGNSSVSLNAPQISLGGQNITINGSKPLTASGGTITGNLSIQGNLTVTGESIIEKQKELEVEDNFIYTNANKVPLTALLSGLGIYKNATDVYAIAYDPAEDTVKLGLGTKDNDGVFHFNTNEGKPVAIRADSSQLTNKHLIVWDDTTLSFVDSGKSVDSIPTSVVSSFNTRTGAVTLQSADVTTALGFTPADATKYVKLQNPKNTILFTDTKNEITVTDAFTLKFNDQFKFEMNGISGFLGGSIETTDYGKQSQLDVDMLAAQMIHIFADKHTNETTTSTLSLQDDKILIDIDNGTNATTLKLTPTAATINDKRILTVDDIGITSGKIPQIGPDGKLPISIVPSISGIVTSVNGKTDDVVLTAADLSALATTDVIDNLTTTDATKVLSANQGKVLDDKISETNQQLSLAKAAITGLQNSVADNTANITTAQSTADTALTTANGAVSKNTEQDASISALQTADGQNVKLTGDQYIGGVKDFTGTLKIAGKDAVSIEETGEGYIRYSDGTQICYGYYDNGNTTNDKSGVAINFTKPFISAPSLVMTSGKTDNTLQYRTTYCNFYSLSTTGALGGWYGNTANYLTWLAIGRWK